MKIRAEASPGSYVHPLIPVQNQVLSKIKAGDDDDGSRCRQVSVMMASSGPGVGCGPQNENSASVESNCESVRDLGNTNRMSIMNMSPMDEVEGELACYQHQLLCNAVARKHLSAICTIKKPFKQRNRSEKKKRKKVMKSTGAGPLLGGTGYCYVTHFPATKT